MSDPIPTCAGVDKLTSLTDARGNRTVFEYDLSSRLVKETSPMGYSKSYTHDPSGNRLTRTDEKGDVTLYSYDPLNRLRSIRYPNGDTTAFDYDNRGNLTQAANQNIGYTFTYDLDNRLTGVSDSLGRVILYQYDGLGKRTRMTGPDGKTISYQYDVANRLSEILTPTGTFAFSHDPIGRRTGLSYPNGVQTDYAYDPSGFLTSLSARISQKPPVSSFAFAHDAVGNRTAMTDLAGNHEYAYDAIDQLTRAAHPTRPPEQFQYDPVGNRQTTVVDSDNALLEDEDFVYTYDAQGNRIEKASKITGRKTTYSYDPDNRLVKAETPATLARYKYDPFGRRIEKEVNGQITRHLYDGPNILLEYDGQNNIKSSYLHTLAIDDPLALEQNGKAYYYHKDGLGSIRSLTDEAGQLIQSYEYTGFGKITSQSGSLEQPFTFTGRELDQMLAQEETTSWITYSTELKPGVQDLQGMKGGGRIEIRTPRQTEDLYFYRARYYDPKAGRFLTKDPIGFVGGDTNLYRYVGNNPVNYRDPSGLRFFPLHMVDTYFGAILAFHDPITSLYWAVESAVTDFETGSLSSDQAEITNAHGLAGKEGMIRQTGEQAVAGMYRAIAESTARGGYGRACHTIGDMNTPGHRGRSYSGDLSFEHSVNDLSPEGMGESIWEIRRYLLDNAPPSLPVDTKIAQSRQPRGNEE